MLADIRQQSMQEYFHLIMGMFIHHDISFMVNQDRTKYDSVIGSIDDNAVSISFGIDNETLCIRMICKNLLMSSVRLCSIADFGPFTTFETIIKTINDEIEDWKKEFDSFKIVDNIWSALLCESDTNEYERKDLNCVL